jgi:lysophospholipase
MLMNATGVENIKTHLMYDGKLHMPDETWLYYRMWLPPIVDSAVILVHGAGEHVELYQHMGRLVSDGGHAFVVFDLRGFGRSGGKSGHITSFGEYITDMNHLIRFVKTKLGAVPVFLVGHSLGGLIVTRYAQTHPHTIQGIVLSAPALGLRINIPPSLIRIISFISRITPELSVNPYRLMERAKRISRFKPYLCTSDMRTRVSDPLVALRYSFRWVQELLVHIQTARIQSGHIRVPTFCLCGARDPIISPEAVRSFFDALTIKEKEWLLLPDADHSLLHSHQADPAVGALLQWLKQWKQNEAQTK